MKKSLIAALMVSVAGGAVAATLQPSLSNQQIKAVHTDLSASQTKTAGVQAQPQWEGWPGARGEVKLPQEMGFATPAEAEYYHLKLQDLPIPASLLLEVFGPPAQGGARNGGETFATAAPITFTAGGTFTDNGTTVGFANDIPSGQVAPAMCNTSFFTVSFGGPDAVYTFTLPAAYTVSASTCNNASYDSCLGIFNSAGQLVAVNDDGTGCSNWSSLIDPCCLAAGTYYVVVDGYGADSGTYTLTVAFGATPCGTVNPCDDAPTLGCGGSATGTTVGNQNYVGNPAPDAFFEIVITESGPVTFSLCDGGTNYDSFLRLYNGCPTTGGVEIGANDDACGLQSELVVALDPGTYWLVVEGYSSASGNYSLDINCASCDPITCVGIDEGEPNSGPAEFGGNDTYGEIDCGVTVCGTVWAIGGTRDTDWLELFLLEGSILTITSEVELFDPLVFVIDATYNIVAQANNNGFCEGESLTTDCLAAGIYYVWMGHSSFDGVPEDQAYSISLSCAPCTPIDPCDAATPIACNQTVNGNSGMSQGNAWETYCFGGENGPEVLYQLNHSGGFLTITMTSGTTEDLDMALLGSCDPLDCLDMPWAVGPNESMSGTYPAGTYYIVVDAWNWSGSAFSFTLNVVCGADPCEDVQPVNCLGTPETEPNEGWNDQNASYNTLVCGEVKCGSVWATGGNRDLDWYRFVHTGGDLLIETQIEAFDCILFLTDFALGGNIIASSNAAPMCVPETMFVPAVPAGEYYVVIAHSLFEGVPNDQDYALLVTCFGDPCEDHTPITCVGTAETEPNEGWNATPPNDSYGLIADGQTICGSVWADAGTRDLDWFRFTVTETVNVRISSEVDWFDCILFLTDFAAGGNILTAADANGACTGEMILYECLSPGQYYAVIAHNAFEGVPEDQNYSLTLEFETCTPVDPCADMVNGGNLENLYTVSRPAPIANHHNAVNGCTGISSAGYDELHMLTLTAQADVRVTMTGQGNADEVIYILTNCQSTASCVAGRDEFGNNLGGETMDVANLPAGTYYIVADYWGSAEARAFTLQVRNLTTALGETFTPLAFELQQNYPNPFNPTTTISWTQPDLMPASLAVYNLAGAVVQEFNLGFRGAGVHSYTWDASQLPSGVYFYSLTTGGETLTRKAVLLK